MNNVKVKICGIRSLEAAQAAIDAGADFLGFNFVPSSKRFIDIEKAKEIILSLRALKGRGNLTREEIVPQGYLPLRGGASSSTTPHNDTLVKIVGIFQDADAEEVNRVGDLLGLDYVQLHGEEDSEYVSKIKR